MHRLWAQLSLGFALVTLLTTLGVALLVNTRPESTFRGYLAQSQVADSGVLERLALLYADQGGWADVSPLLTMAGGGMGRGQGAGGMRASLALADDAGQVIADPAGMVGGPALSAAQRREALPIVVDGATVGLLLARTAGGSALPLAAERFLATLNETLWLAGLLAGGLGLGLGLIMARGLAAPLDRLAAAARQIAQGRRAEPLPASGPAELRTVAAAFNEMAAALEAGETQRRHMVADIAHELRTPLTVIQGNLRAILDDVYPLSKAEVATIYETTRGLRRLVDDLRELSLAEAGRLDLERRPLAVAPLLAREAALFAELAAGQGVALQVAAAPGLPAISADAERLAQILHNLLSNALRHTPAGGRVTLAAEPAAGGVRFAVVDTGAGIDPADLPHLFERFYRADRGRARATGGSGLGLAIVSHLVRLHGGSVGVESEPGQGARFWFTIPAA